MSPYEEIYRTIHRDPELSIQEENTAKLVAKNLKESGYRVIEGIGGHGVVGIFTNENRRGHRQGRRKTVLLRAEMDALPIKEKTGLEYASVKTMEDTDGSKNPVMHACGHDMHIAVLLATAALLHNARSSWSGTLIVLFQPNEERNGGARAMVEDGLYEKIIPVPDIILGQHVVALKAGVVAIRSGPILTAADSFDVRVFGKGGHAGTPQHCIDPILTTSLIIVRLQTIVSREINPTNTAIISCGSIHAGSAGNIIPDYVDLKVNVRTYSPHVREKVLASMQRIFHAEAQASGAERMPTIKQTERTPMTINDTAKTQILTNVFNKFFLNNSWEMQQDTATEDFDNLASPRNIPYVYWNFGGTDADRWDKANKEGKLSELIPENHSAYFAPVIEPTMRTGVDAFALAALTFLT